MRLSEAPEVRSWLAQFENSDRPTAELLANSLQLVPPMELEASTRSLIEYVAGQHKSATALYAARELDDWEREHSLWRD